MSCVLEKSRWFGPGCTFSSAKNSVSGIVIVRFFYLRRVWSCNKISIAQLPCNYFITCTVACRKIFIEFLRNICVYNSFWSAVILDTIHNNRSCVWILVMKKKTLFEFILFTLSFGFCRICMIKNGWKEQTRRFVLIVWFCVIV